MKNNIMFIGISLMLLSCSIGNTENNATQVATVKDTVAIAPVDTFKLKDYNDIKLVSEKTILALKKNVKDY